MLPSAGEQAAEALAEEHGAGVGLGELLVVDQLQAVDLGGGEAEDRGVVAQPGRGRPRPASPTAPRPRMPSVGQDRGRRAEGVPAQSTRRGRGGRRWAAVGSGRAAGVEVGEPGDGVAEVRISVGRRGDGRGAGGSRDRPGAGRGRDQGGGREERAAARRGAAAAGRGRGSCPRQRRGGRRVRLPRVAATPRRRVGSFQEMRATVLGCEHPTIHRPSCPARARWPPWAISPATCAGPGTPRRRTSSRAIDPELWESTQPRPGAAARRGRPRAARRARRRRRLPRPARRGPRRPRRATSPGPLVRPQGRRRTRPAPIAYFSPEFGITAVLPQYSGGLGILAGDHLKAASDLGVPIIGVGLLYRHGYFKQSLSREGWQQETYPVLDPDELPLSLLREADGTARRRLASPCPAAPTLRRPDLGRQRRPGAAAAARHRRRGEPRPLPRRHRPALRRQHRAPAAPGAAARRRRRPRPARLRPHHRRPRARGLPHQRGPRRLPRPRADPRAHRRRGRPAARLRHRARGLAAPAPSSPPTRPVPAGIDRFPRELVEQYFGGNSPDPRRARRADPGARRRGLRRRRRRRLQHGGHGLPPRPARQRRLRAARPRVSRGMFNGLWPAFDEAEVPIGSITNGVHAPTWVAREVFDLAGEPRRRRRRRRHRRALGRSSTRSRDRDIWDLKRHAARAASSTTPARGCGESSAEARLRARPSSAGSTPRSTPTC